MVPNYFSRILLGGSGGLEYLDLEIFGVRFDQKLAN
jgi:hypothetical protein